LGGFSFFNNVRYNTRKHSGIPMNKIETMLRLQQELNDTTNGIGWEDGTTKNNKQIDWRRCIWLEAAELVESYPWKHWKSISAEPDRANIKIEAVDIWHFVMSEALRQYTMEERGDIASLAETMMATEAYEVFVTGDMSQESDVYDEIACVEKMVELLFANASVEAWTAQFYRVALRSGLNLNELYRLYVGKNILNRFRQDHGYKEGTYSKIWNGEEDNVAMQRLLERETSMTPDALYAALETLYGTGY
jgi:dimeric dUTPase (all-alpha-NTP-PPase superfamily)